MRRRRCQSQLFKSRKSVNWNSPFFVMQSFQIWPPSSSGLNSMLPNPIFKICIKLANRKLQQSSWLMWWVRIGEQGMRKHEWLWRKTRAGATASILRTRNPMSLNYSEALKPRHPSGGNDGLCIIPANLTLIRPIRGHAHMTTTVGGTPKSRSNKWGCVIIAS